MYERRFYVMAIWFKDLLHFYKRNHTLLKIIISLIILLILLMNALFSLIDTYDYSATCNPKSYFISNEPKKFCIH